MISHFDRENTIVHLDADNRFSHDDEDEHIINTVAEDEPKPVVWVTADLKQKREANERAALRNSKMHVVFFNKRFNANKPHYQAMKILAVWPTLQSLCTTAKQPTAFEVPSGPQSSAKVDTLGPTSELLS